MTHEEIKNLFNSSIEHVVSNISDYSVRPYKDFSRNKKITAENLISYLVSQGSSSTKIEMLAHWDMDAKMPSTSALIQQRSKLKPDALRATFNHFNAALYIAESFNHSDGDYRFLAADGSTFSFFSNHSFASDDYYCAPGHSAKGFYSMHLNAFFDLEKQTYTDAIIQAVHKKNEFSAFCDIVDRHDIQEGRKNIYIGDRGYCSYNNMAHVIEQNQHFLFRTKDIHSKGLVGNFDFPDEPSFDIDVKVTLTRSQSKKVAVSPDTYRRFIGKDASFDYIDYGSYSTYELNFRIVRFPISESSFECIVTNLPRDEFPLSRIKTIYNARWDIETSFRKLKYTIGLSNFHGYKPEFIEQEIWAKLIAYNTVSTMINHTELEQCERKHEYKINFTTATYICRIYLRLSVDIDSYDVMTLLQKNIIPIRKDREYPRLQTAHFRKPRYFLYRAA